MTEVDRCRLAHGGIRTRGPWRATYREHYESGKVVEHLSGPFAARCEHEARELARIYFVLSTTKYGPEDVEIVSVERG